MPVYPFPFHLQRREEPALPRFTPDDIAREATDRAHAEQRERRTWRTWALQQPDSRLMYIEYVFSQLLFYSKGDMIPEEISLTQEEQLKEAIRLRSLGYGEIIETYWPHLSK